MRRAVRWIAALALLALAGCGGGAPSSVVPADARLYVGLKARG
jgi:predicted small lipoprotein YifL